MRMFSEKFTGARSGALAKNSLMAATLCLLMAFINISCSLKGMLTGPPAPSVLEEGHLPYKVAILPFVNKTSNPEAGEIVRKMFYNFFSSLNYMDVELSVIDSTLETNDLYSKITAGEEVSPAMLGQLLGADAIIFGDVLSLGKVYALVYHDNQAGLKSAMVRCDNGQLIWELEHTIHIEEGDVPLSPIGLAATIVMTAITHKQANHLEAASELCMQMVATIPNPAAFNEPPPKIQALVHNGAGRLLRPGDYVKVVMIGEKGQKASWGIPTLIEDLPMKEKEPGIYIGAYRIRTQDRLPHGRLVGYLRSDKGSGSQWVDTLGPLKIGEPTILPPVISNTTVLNKDKNPYLVKDALVVLPGARLIINPGTVIWFRSLGLIVRGEIQILGTEKTPVRLASLGTSTWKGIMFDRSRSDNKIHYCEILDAEFGIKASDSDVFIQNCLIQDNIWGIVIDRGTAEIQNSLIRTSEKTGVAARDAQLAVRNSIITENHSGGFLIDTSRVRIEQNNIVNNGGWGIKVLRNQGQIQASNNWWGNEKPDQNEIIGAVNIQPVLDKPIDFLLPE